MKHHETMGSRDVKDVQVVLLSWSKVLVKGLTADTFDEKYLQYATAVSVRAHNMAQSQFRDNPQGPRACTLCYTMNM